MVSFLASGSGFCQLGIIDVVTYELSVHVVNYIYN